MMLSHTFMYIGRAIYQCTCKSSKECKENLILKFHRCYKFNSGRNLYF